MLCQCFSDSGTSIYFLNKSVQPCSGSNMAIICNMAQETYNNIKSLSVITANTHPECVSLV